MGGGGGGAAVAGALSASLAPDLPDPDMPHYSYTTNCTVLQIMHFYISSTVYIAIVHCCVEMMIG